MYCVHTAEKENLSCGFFFVVLHENPRVIEEQYAGLAYKLECKVLLRHGFGTALQHPHHHLSPVFKQQTNKKL